MHLFIFVFFIFATKKGPRSVSVWPQLKNNTTAKYKKKFTKTTERYPEKN